MNELLLTDVYTEKMETTFISLLTEDHTTEQLLIGIKKYFYIDGKKPNIRLEKIETEKGNQRSLLPGIKVLDKLFFFDNEKQKWVLRTFSEPTLDILNYGYNNDKRKIIMIGDNNKQTDQHYINECLIAKDAEYLFYNLKDNTNKIDIKSLAETLKSTEDHNSNKYYFIFPSGYPLDQLVIDIKCLVHYGIKFNQYMLGNTVGKSELYRISINDTNIHFRRVGFYDE